MQLTDSQLNLFAKTGIQTADLWCWKRPLCELRLNHGQIYFLATIFISCFIIKFHCRSFQRVSLDVHQQQTRNLIELRHFGWHEKPEPSKSSILSGNGRQAQLFDSLPRHAIINLCGVDLLNEGLSTSCCH